MRGAAQIIRWESEYYLHVWARPEIRRINLHTKRHYFHRFMLALTFEVV
jgi:hypothetical protein